MASPKGRPELLKYLDHRLFIRDYTEFLKSKGVYSARTFAKSAGFSSPSFVNEVVLGKRNLTSGSVGKFISAFELPTVEAGYFKLLVNFGQAENLEEKNKAYEAILKFHKKRSIQDISEDRFKIFKKWQSVVYLEALNSKFADLPVPEQAERLGLSVGEFRELISSLERAEFIKVSGKTVLPSTRSLATPQEARSLELRNLHSQMIQRALESVNGVDQSERHLASVSLLLSEENYIRLTNLIMEFIKDVNTEFEDAKKPRAVYQLNCQLFPILPLEASRE